MRVADLVRVLDMIIPGACPELPTGPPSLIRGEQSQAPYIVTYGAFPPHWDDDRRLSFECMRDDSVMIMWRKGAATRTQRDAACRWLRRHGLDDLGRPLVWGEQSPAGQVPHLALAG